MRYEHQGGECYKCDLRIENQSDSRPDRGRLPYMAVEPLSRSATIKVGHVGAREPTFTMHDFIVALRERGSSSCARFVAYLTNLAFKITSKNFTSRNMLDLQ
jgi:hypothetical protein